MLLLLLLVVVVEMVVVGIVGVVVAVVVDDDVKMLCPAFIVEHLSAGTAATAALRCSTPRVTLFAHSHAPRSANCARALRRCTLHYTALARQAAHFHPRHSILSTKNRTLN